MLYEVFQQCAPIKDADDGRYEANLVKVGEIEADTAEQAIRQASAWEIFYKHFPTRALPGRESLMAFPMVQVKSRRESTNE